MIDDEYRALMDSIVAIAQMTLAIPREDMGAARAIVDRVSVIGPFFNPTAFLHGADKRLRDQSDLLQAFAGLRAVVERFQEEAAARAALPVPR